MDKKELRSDEEQHDANNGATDRDVAKGNGACYENKGFNDSNSSREELFDETEDQPTNRFSKSVMISEETPDVILSKDGYVNNAFEDGSQNTDKGTVPRAHETDAIAVATSSENQISKLDEGNNGVVAVDLETKEKKWKVQFVGWDSSRSALLLGLVLVFDAWAVVFYCFKSDIFTNILR